MDEYELSHEDALCDHGYVFGMGCSDCHAEQAQSMLDAGYHYCGAVTKKGSPCKNWAKDSDHCDRHAV